MKRRRRETTALKISFSTEEQTAEEQTTEEQNKNHKKKIDKGDERDKTQH